MTFLDNPLAEAILIELRRIAAAGERMATAYEKVARFAESKGSAGVSAKPETSGETKKRSKAEPKDILAVTGYVLHFGQAVNAATNEPKTTKAKESIVDGKRVVKEGRPYWTLKLTNGFFANIFSESYAAICSRAYDEQRPLIVDYVKEGQYSNIESVKLAAVAEQAAAPAGREPGEDDNSPF